MLSNSEYVKQSLDINLFFLRIMKEHSLFIQASLPSKNYNLIQQASMFKETFEHLLAKAINLSHGVVKINNDMVTKYTYEAERATGFLTGIPIDSRITRSEMSLSSQNDCNKINPMLVQCVQELNNCAIMACKNIICFKTFILDNVLTCKLFTSNYPLLIEHILREAEFYLDILVKLEKRISKDIVKDAVKQEAFWNQIMAEHSKFIRGFLDPTEEELFKISNAFGNEFDELTEEALDLTNEICNLPMVTKESKSATKKLRDFKAQATKGLIDCNIRSITVPLLGDHVLREANHYLILLNEYEHTI